MYLRSEGEGETRRTKGFVTADALLGEIHSSRFEDSDKACALGFYRWPQRWTIALAGTGKDGPALGQLELHQLSRQNQGNWIVGGFALSVVTGVINMNGVIVPVWGFAELIQ